MQETGIPDNINELDDKMSAASRRLEECYELERAEAEVAGMVLENESDYRGWKDLARLGAQAAAAIAKREKATADAEKELNLILHERAAAIHWAKIPKCIYAGHHSHLKLPLSGSREFREDEGRRAEGCRAASGAK